jgi:hypothetical protein
VGRSALWVSLLSSIVLASSAFAAGPFGSLHVGNWKGGAYTDDKTGAFSHCAASTAYGSGVHLSIAYNVSGGFVACIWTRSMAPEHW